MHGYLFDCQQSCLHSQSHVNPATVTLTDADGVECYKMCVKICMKHGSWKISDDVT
jgi:hypothetical protein